MQKTRSFTVKSLPLVLGFTILFLRIGLAQSVYLPYSYQLDQKFDADIYSTHNSFHTALKPYLIDSVLAPKYNQLMQLGVDTTRKSWVSRKLFNEHLFDVKTKEFTFYGDYLPDLQIGRDISGKRNTNLNTRAYQFGGTVGDKFSFYSSGYEDQGVFPAYYDAVVNSYHFVPGQSYDRSFGKKTKDWSYATAIISYTPIKQLNITLGEDKTFIGDGYRSLLLSDYAAPYPLLRLTANLGKVQYMAMWAYMEDAVIKKYDGFGSNRRKWGMFHYLDWNVTNRLSLGFFNALIAAEADDNGNLHGFDLNYINPVILASSLGPSTPVPDNTFAGLTGKYKIFDKTAFYGQLLVDHYSSNNSAASPNTYGYQLGIRGADIFKIKNLNYL
ncbi:MAG TPA: gliding motility protein RemB, partial [Mucilaginibacter sp.]